MSARQVVSRLQSQLQFVHIVVGCHAIQQCVVAIFLSHFVILFLQNVANEGSEEQGFYAFMHWLIGEFGCNRYRHIDVKKTPLQGCKII